VSGRELLNVQACTAEYFKRTVSLDDKAMQQRRSRADRIVLTRLRRPHFRSACSENKSAFCHRNASNLVTTDLS
jgi:hypothetical protein